LLRRFAARKDSVPDFDIPMHIVYNRTDRQLNDGGEFRANSARTPKGQVHRSTIDGRISQVKEPQTIGTLESWTRSRSNADGASRTALWRTNLSGKQTEDVRRNVVRPLSFCVEEIKMPTMVPSFLLKKLYVKGSFQNTPNGFQLSLRNTLAPGTILSLSPLQIDGRDVPLANIEILSGDNAPVRASDISLAQPKAFPLNVLITFRVIDQPLTPGLHRVTVIVNTKEAGELKIDAEDSIE
jgi:hypothetical protein